MTSTYRIQLNKNFGFKQVEGILSYLAKLGITHLYFSPYLHARPGSMHGYDILNHRELNPELGSHEDYLNMVKRMSELNLKQIFDMVPNHMGIIGEANEWWTDVLENGRASLYSEYFDIDWYKEGKPEFQNKILLPVLGCPYGQALESGEIKFNYEGGKFFVSYYDSRFPISVCTYESILQPFYEEIESTLGSESVEFVELQSIVTACRNLPRQTDTNTEKKIERTREIKVIQRRLDLLIKESPPLKRILEESAKVFAGTVGRPHSFDRLDSLLNEQVYRLSHFRVAADEINYRRFFDINELVALKMEVPEVFDASHQFLFELVRSGYVSGIRVDHVDGLFDPKRYLTVLRTNLERLSPEADRYLIVEKILTDEEELRTDWPVDGTTGYEFLSLVNSLFVDSRNEKLFNKIYSSWSYGTPPFSDAVVESKRLIQQIAMSSEVHSLAHQIDKLSEWNRHSRDFTFAALTDTLKEIIACFPVYRSYGDEDGLSEIDQRRIKQAVSEAKRRNPAVHSSLFDFVQNTLLLIPPGEVDQAYKEAQLKFLRTFQQVTGPITAKGVEDTSFYYYNRFISLNEVGSSPERFGISAELFHSKMITRKERWPRSLSATATHDTKRGEDTRARLNTLSELPEHFEETLLRFENLNAKFYRKVNGKEVPDRNIAYLLYQTLLGTWPSDFSVDQLPQYQLRIKEYMGKATHELKKFTSWINPNVEYDEAISDFISDILSENNQEFLKELTSAIRPLVEAGTYNSLSQTVIKLTAPGIPDFYQGCELLDFSLVDPDNRRAVDFDRRTMLLEEVSTKGLNDLSSPEEVKLFVIWKLLNLRKEKSRFFLEANYSPVYAEGEKSEHLISFSRMFNGESLLVVVPRFMARLLTPTSGRPNANEFWSKTELLLPRANGAINNLLSGQKINVKERITVGELLADCPVGVFSL